MQQSHSTLELTGVQQAALHLKATDHVCCGCCWQITAMSLDLLVYVLPASASAPWLCYGTHGTCCAYASSDVSLPATAPSDATTSAHASTTTLQCPPQRPPAGASASAPWLKPPAAGSYLPCRSSSAKRAAASRAASLRLRAQWHGTPSGWCNGLALLWPQQPAVCSVPVLSAGSTGAHRHLQATCSWHASGSAHAIAQSILHMWCMTSRRASVLVWM